MPIYDFRCCACGAQFELLVRGPAQPVCPECLYDDPERLPSLTAPQGTIKTTITKARRAAAQEGHFSNYSAAEKANLIKRMADGTCRGGQSDPL